MMLKFKILNVLIIFMVVVFVIFIHFYTGDKSINQIVRLETSFKKCNPIIKNATQFYALIDGVKYPKIVPSFFNSSINFDCLNKNKKTKLILLWNEYGPWHDYKYGLGKITPFVNRKCPVTNCEITKDKKRLNESDLIIIHMRGDYSKLPKYRPKDSRTVFLITESPIHTNTFDKLVGYFNLTATYKKDSYFSPFYYSNIGFKWELNNEFNDEKDFSESKTKLAAILVTNCNAHSKRIEYVKEMQKYAPIEIFGGCGIQCNITGENRFLSKQCREKISKQYKFFLAFENSFCTDYVTEKLFDTLLFDIVPVVLGRGPYDEWIPKSAYINAMDFESPKHLAEYLLYLSNNSTAYNSFFKWKKYIKITNHEYKTFCDMCIKLQLETHFGIKKSIFNNIEEFWGYKKNCLMPSINNGVFKYVPINYEHKCPVC